MRSSKQENDALLAGARRSRAIVLWVMVISMFINTIVALIGYFTGAGVFNIALLVIVFGSTFLVLIIHHGINPLRWWKAVSGTEIILDYSSKTAMTVEERQNYLNEVEQWTKAELPSCDVVKVNPWRYHFRRKDQAMLFKITWL